MEHWQLASTTPHASIELSSRYFTEKKRAPNEEDIPFGPMVDPNNVLEELKGDHFVHGLDNYVEYLEKNTRDGKTK